MSIAVPAAPDYASDIWPGPSRPEHPQDHPEEAVDVCFAPGNILAVRGGLGLFRSGRPRRTGALARRRRLTQASAFAAAGSIFQPHCRQAVHGDEPAARARTDESLRRALRGHPGRLSLLSGALELKDGPSILAGHSQGAIVLLELMKNTLADPELCSRLVAAYIIGYSVTAADLAAHPGMRLASGPDDTGVIVTYNTLAKGGTRGLTLLPGALCVNPLNWVIIRRITPRPGLDLGMAEFDDAGRLRYARSRVSPTPGSIPPWARWWWACAI